MNDLFKHDRNNKVVVLLAKPYVQYNEVTRLSVTILLFDVLGDAHRQLTTDATA